MTAPMDRLATAIADRYRIERELGQGGMGTGDEPPTKQNREWEFTEPHELASHGATPSI